MASQERNHKVTSWGISVLVHLLLLLFVWSQYFNKPDLKEEIAGIYIRFGEPESITDMGEEGDQASSESPVEENEMVEKTSESEVSKPTPKPTTTSINNATTKSENKPISKENNVASPPPAETRSKSAEELAKEAEAKKQAELEASKKKFGSLFNQGGSGNPQRGSSQGNPDQGVLDDLVVGVGNVGQGLANRGLLYEPRIDDSTQKTGKVALDICVNAEGNVIQATYTQRGSTTADAYLIELARKAAFQYRFTADANPKQCGNLLIDFKVK